MAKLQRVVSITDFNLKSVDKQTAEKSLHAQFLQLGAITRRQPKYRRREHK